MRQFQYLSHPELWAFYSEKELWNAGWCLDGNASKENPYEIHSIKQKYLFKGTRVKDNVLQGFKDTQQAHLS